MKTNSTSIRTTTITSLSSRRSMSTTHVTLDMWDLHSPRLHFRFMDLELVQQIVTFEHHNNSTTTTILILIGMVPIASTLMKTIVECDSSHLRHLYHPHSLKNHLKYT